MCVCVCFCECVISFVHACRMYLCSSRAILLVCVLYVLRELRVCLTCYMNACCVPHICLVVYSRYRVRIYSHFSREDDNIDEKSKSLCFSLPKFECNLANVVLCFNEFFVLKDTGLCQYVSCSNNLRVLYLQCCVLACVSCVNASREL